MHRIWGTERSKYVVYKTKRDAVTVTRYRDDTVTKEHST
jgi:hypothetical protein